MGRATDDDQVHMTSEVQAFFPASTFINTGNGIDYFGWTNRVQGSSIHELAPALVENSFQGALSGSGPTPTPWPWHMD